MRVLWQSRCSVAELFLYGSKPLRGTSLVYLGPSPCSSRGFPLDCHPGSACSDVVVEDQDVRR